MVLYHKLCMLLIVFFCLNNTLLPQAFPQQSEIVTSTSLSKNLTLSQAVICEGIEDFVPQNEAIVFSITIGKVFCFSFFESIPKKTFIYHNWYFQDRLAARIKLTLKPPQWRTYSTIHLREADKGPWRVEITDSKNHTFKVLRFSITD